MSTDIPLLVGAGSVPELRMREAAEDLARLWALPLQTHATGASPATVLTEAEPGLIRLSGDPARQRHDGGHWLDALADWRRPLLLLVPGETDGSVSGQAAAYAALCDQLGAPLRGLIQIQGSWNQEQRRRDGLLWCGWIPARDDSAHAFQLDRLHLCLRRSGVVQTPTIGARGEAAAQA